MSLVRISDIKDEVTREFNLRPHDLAGERRAREYVIPRHIAFKLAKLHTTYSWARIGSAFGNRDHSTVISGISSIEERMRKEPEIRERFEALNERLTELAAANSNDTASE